MKKRLLILDSSIDPTTYQPVEHWTAYLHDVGYDSVHLPSGEAIPRLSRYSHIILTGSNASFVDPDPWFKVEAHVVREAVERNLAILGSCFGHQMLVWALSGPPYVRPATIPELGWISVDIVTEDPLLEGLPNPWHAFAAHMDEVVAPPTPWRILASNDACAVQAIRYGDRPVWGIQPHPEIPPAEARVQMKLALDRYPAFEHEIRQAIDAPVEDDGVTAQLVGAFLRAE